MKSNGLLTAVDNNRYKPGRNGKKWSLSVAECVLVIMAGGKGIRLHPFTKILPKPLLPIDNKTVIETILDRFNQAGIRDFYLTVHYKGHVIKSYLDNVGLEYTVDYIWEDDYWGTAGSLCLLPKEMPSTFIVSNCDIVVEADYEEMLAYHNRNNNSMTIVGARKSHVIPYGVIKCSSSSLVSGIEEKPCSRCIVNTGLYILEREVIDNIPERKRFDMTHLIDRLINKGDKVKVYLVDEERFIDVGQWPEYKRNLEKLAESTVV